MEFKSSFEDIDLSGDLNPPTNIFIDVRVLRDGGEVTTEYGSFNLIKILNSLSENLMWKD